MAPVVHLSLGLPFAVGLFPSAFGLAFLSQEPEAAWRCCSLLERGYRCPSVYQLADGRHAGQFSRIGFRTCYPPTWHPGALKIFKGGSLRKRQKWDGSWGLPVPTSLLQGVVKPSCEGCCLWSGTTEASLLRKQRGTHKSLNKGAPQSGPQPLHLPRPLCSLLFLRDSSSHPADRRSGPTSASGPCFLRQVKRTSNRFVKEIGACCCKPLRSGGCLLRRVIVAVDK